MYRQGGRVYKCHHLLYAPDFETVDKLNGRLAQFGDLGLDGRPTLGLSARDLLEVVRETSPRCYLIPAHIWTPWFGMLGSRSGGNSVEEVFADMTPYIFALETGLSSDPRMNWCVEALDNYALVSNSDAHSARNLGREATCFDTEFSYDALFEALQTKQGLEGTLEYFPEEGKYHLDGHRACKLRLNPVATQKHQGICPVCRKQLTVGVLHRVQLLGGGRKPIQPKDAPNFDYIVPLREVIGEIVGKGVQTKRVQIVFKRIIEQFGSAFDFLLKTPLVEIAKYMPGVYAESIDRLRKGEVVREAGYDGIYGKISLTKAPTTLFSVG